LPGVPATPCKKGYKKLKTRLHEKAGGGEKGGGGEIYSGYSLALMQKRLFRGPAGRARDIIGPGRVHICMHMYDRDRKGARIHCRTPIIIPAN